VNLMLFLSKVLKDGRCGMNEMVHFCPFLKNFSLIFVSKKFFEIFLELSRNFFVPRNFWILVGTFLQNSFFAQILHTF